jgi:hypothetical protein
LQTIDEGCPIKKRGDNDNRWDDSDDNNDYEGEGMITRERDQTENEFLCARCLELENAVKSLRTEIRVLKSHDRQMKHQMRIDYEWDGEEANLLDKVSYWVKTYLFPSDKFLKDGWMKYSDGHESLLSFVQRKMKMEDVEDFRGQWERVICPTIQMKYVTTRCNLKNEV